jgi:cation transport ATPase
MNDLLGLLKNIAPALATAVAGPLGGAAVSAIASRLGVSDSVEAVAKAIAGDPQAAQKIQELELEMTKVAMDAQKNEDNNVTERWQSDNQSEGWLNKNIRPATLVYLLTTYNLFALMSAFGHQVNESYVNLLGQWGMLVMTAYFGGKTIENIMKIKGSK